MATIKLNLLPPELAVDKNVGRILKTLRALNLILVATFLVFTLGISAFFVVSSITLRNSLASIETLKGQIKTRQTSEQQIVLLKDRIKKITIARNIPNSLNNLSAVDPLLLSLSPDSSVTGLDVDPEKIGLLVNFKSTSDLTTFFEGLSSSTAYKTVTLSSFGFNPVAGYLAGLSVFPK